MAKSKVNKEEKTNKYIANVLLKFNGEEVKAGEEILCFEELTPRLQQALLNLKRVRIE